MPSYYLADLRRRFTENFKGCSMPELPEVEVTLRGIKGALDGALIKSIYHSDKSLRVPMSDDLYKLEGATVTKLERRAKYILITTTKGSVLIHLGMTGHLSVLESSVPRKTHDHFEMVTGSDVIVRLNDTRRFGLVLYYDIGDDPFSLSPLKDLGPEPFSETFTPDYLYTRLKRCKKSIKQCLMDNAIVVGVGNIYASEVLFESRISPLRLGCSIKKKECELIVANIQQILSSSIEKGGTTIRDFEGADGKLGYFVQNLNVYGHDNEPCRICGTNILSCVQGQRTTYYCPKCQN